MVGWTNRAALLSGLLAVGFGVVLGAAQLILLPRLRIGRQMRDSTLLALYADGLGRIRKQEGRFPERLEAVLGTVPLGRNRQDAWGHEVLYWSDGDGFLLVTTGRDGLADLDRYRDLYRRGRLPAGKDVCGASAADQVLSDRGWHIACR